jgi:hypothetical protein
VTANPKPGHVPIWIGGNSALTRRRVARFGDAWNPFPASPQLAKTARTQPLEGLDDLAPLIDDLRHLVRDEGRDPATIDVQFSVHRAGPGSSEFSGSEWLDTLGDMAAIGVTWNNVSVPATSLEQALEALEQFGAEVIAKQG